ncbi:hypothetical protein LJC09_02605 [Desulfovibrio sp. OttesenSCG-928-F20]|nr:hypothetical protein [Desulfovibrio sp. OttesenSCG-928-F20]
MSALRRGSGGSALAGLFKCLSLNLHAEAGREIFFKSKIVKVFLKVGHFDRSSHVSARSLNKILDLSSDCPAWAFVSWGHGVGAGYQGQWPRC